MLSDHPQYIYYVSAAWPLMLTSYVMIMFVDIWGGGVDEKIVSISIQIGENSAFRISRGAYSR